MLGILLSSFHELIHLIPFYKWNTDVRNMNNLPHVTNLVKKPGFKYKEYITKQYHNMAEPIYSPICNV